MNIEPNFDEWSVSAQGKAMAETIICYITVIALQFEKAPSIKIPVFFFFFFLGGGDWPWPSQLNLT